jgi:hypothetical protein
MASFQIQALESLAFEWDSYGFTFQERLSELTDYRTIHGHCNVHQNYSENTQLGDWVTRQRLQYRKHLEHLEGKTSRMTTFRIQALESLDFDWGLTAWEDYFSELADYQKIHGHCNVPKSYSENTKLTDWVAAQRETYRLHLEGKTSPMTPFFIQELECLGFEWDSWEDRFSELADFREIHGHCSVLKSNSDNSMLNNWAETQRKQYRKH